MPGYVTDVLTDLALEWLERRDPTRPFLLLLHHKAPHRPWEPSTEPGSVSDDIVLNVDFAPTFLDAPGLAPSARMQGLSMAEVLRGATPPTWRTSMYYRYWMHLDSIHRVEAHAGVRTRDRKLVCYYGHGSGQPGSSDETLPSAWELFDLDADPYELRSVHDDPAYADDLTDLRGELARLVDELGDDLELPALR